MQLNKYQNNIIYKAIRFGGLFIIPPRCGKSTIALFLLQFYIDSILITPNRYSKNYLLNIADKYNFRICKKRIFTYKHFIKSKIDKKRIIIDDYFDVPKINNFWIGFSSMIDFPIFIEPIDKNIISDDYLKIVKQELSEKAFRMIYHQFDYET